MSYIGIELFVNTSQVVQDFHISDTRNNNGDNSVTAIIP